MLRRLSYIILASYALFTAAILLRSLLGQPFQLWMAMLLPLIGVTFALAHSVARLGWRRAVLFLGLTLFLSLAMEALGVATGWVYGPYHYTHRLGPLFLGLVPFTIPLTWYLMLYPAYRIAESIAPRHWRARWLAVAALGSLAMLAWDLAMDPLMASRQHWVWEVQGAYFGVPLHNFWGWWLTGFIILAVYLKLSPRLPEPPAQPPSRSFDRLAVLSYAVTGLGSVGDAWFAGLAGPALTGGAALLAWIIWGWLAAGKPR